MQTRLYKAASDPNGYETVVNLIEKEKLNVEAKDPETGMTAIYFAARTGSLITVRYLIEIANANLDANEHVYNALFFSHFNLDIKVSEYLSRKEIREKFNDNTNLLHAAALISSLDEFKKLVLQNPALVYARNSSGQDVLYYCIKFEANKKIAFLSSVLYPNLKNNLIRTGLIMIDSLQSCHRRTPGDHIDMSLVLAELGKAYCLAGNLEQGNKCYTFAKTIFGTLEITPSLQEAAKRCRSHMAELDKYLKSMRSYTSFFNTKVDLSIEERLSKLSTDKNKEKRANIALK